MAGPWDKYATDTPQAVPTQGIAQPQAQGPWAQYAPNAPVEGAAPVDHTYSGALWPISVDAQGNKSFDSNAGLLGMAKRAFMAPGDALNGNLQVMGADGNVTPEAIGRGVDFANTFNPVNPGITSGDRALPGVLRAVRSEPVPVPTAEALNAAGSAGFKQMRGMGVDYSSDAVSKLAQALQAKMEEDGVIQELAPKTFTILNKLQTPPADSTAPLAGLTAARRAFKNAGKDFNNPTDQMAAGRARQGIDQFIDAADPETVVAGPAGDAARVFQDANGNYAAAKRSGAITDIQDAAELNAGANNSGQNLGNALRQGTKRLLLDPKKSAGFSDEELGQLTGAVKGTPTANVSRFVGNLLGGGGGLGGAVTGAGGALAGAATGSPSLTVAGAALPVLGFGAKKLSQALTQKALNAADEAVRSRSPLYESLMAQAPKEVISPAKRAALVRALMMSQPKNAGNGGGGGY